MLATTSSSKSITVSIVSHGQQALIAPLLRQLDRYCSGVIAKVVLTVNLPEPEWPDNTSCRFPIERVSNARPRGFGANHNAAFTYCETPWFLVLNPDMRLEHDVLSPLLELADPETGVLAPRIFEPGKDQPEPHRAILTPREILRRTGPEYRAPQHPAWIAGMFMLFRTKTYQMVGGFNARYFMYAEDFDICAKLQLSGWNICIGESLRALHEAQRASHRDRRHLYWHFSSLIKLWLSATFWRYLLRGRPERQRAGRA